MPALPTSRAWRRLFPPLVADAAIGLAETGVGLQLALVGQPACWPAFGWRGIALTCLINMSVTFRRRAPFTVLLICLSLWVWYVWLGYWPVVNTLAPMVMVYSVAAQRSPRWAAAASVLLGAVWIYAGIRAPQSTPLEPVVAQALVFPAVIWRFGDVARRLTLSNEELTRTARQLRHEQEERAHEAVALERTRIARELHDVVAHHLSVISVQAGLARYVIGTDRSTAARALDTVLGTCSEALDELRRILTLFRSSPNEPGPYFPSAGLAQLPDLAQRLRTSGVDVTVHTSGTPRQLPPGADLCAYRVAQESSTNILKHAPGSHAEIHLAYGPGTFTIRVTNDGPPRPSGPGTGHGLAGMRERAALYGGTLQAGPRPQGGFEVLLALPLTGAADHNPGELPDS